MEKILIQSASLDFTAIGLPLLVAQNMLLDLSWSTWACGLIVLGILSIFYYYVWLPVDFGPEEIKYDYKNDAPRYKKSRLSSRQILQEVVNRKKIGECPPVFPNGWFALLQSKDLGNGQVKHVQALGENFAVMRSSVGQVHILDAYCPHLGANMAVGGVVKGDCLECPFHGWQFRGEDGTCSRVPYSNKVPKTAAVKNWPSDEVNGSIFVWYHAEGEPPSWRVDSIPEIEGGQLWYRGRYEKLVNSHIQDMVENIADFSHFDVLHSASAFAGVDQRNFNRLVHRFLKHSWKTYFIKNTSPGESHKWFTDVEHSLTLFNKFSLIPKELGNTTQIGPGIVMVKNQGMYIITTFTPVDALVVRIVGCVYCPKSLFLFGPIGLYLMSILIDRDILIWTHKKYAMKPLLAKEDEAIARHRRWFSQFYSANSPRYPLARARESMEW